MTDEKPLPLPLSGSEVIAAVLAKVEENMRLNCHLRDSDAYTSFSADITVKLVLNDYGRVVHQNNIVRAAEDSGLPKEGEARQSEGHLQMEPAPPNQIRVETGQPVPVRTIVDGKPVIRNLKYAPRRPKA